MAFKALLQRHFSVFALVWSNNKPLLLVYVLFTAKFFLSISYIMCFQTDFKRFRNAITVDLLVIIHVFHQKKGSL